LSLHASYMHLLTGCWKTRNETKQEATPYWFWECS